jgi:hypothetical protein
MISETRLTTNTWKSYRPGISGSVRLIQNIMTINRRNFLFLGAAAGLAPSVRSGSRRVRPDAARDRTSGLVDDSVDWAQFLDRQDLLWDAVPATWGESPFLGNGCLAMSVKAPPGDATTKCSYSCRTSSQSNGTIQSLWRAKQEGREYLKHGVDRRDRSRLASFAPPCQVATLLSMN